MSRNSSPLPTSSGLPLPPGGEIPKKRRKPAPPRPLQSGGVADRVNTLGNEIRALLASKGYNPKVRREHAELLISVTPDGTEARLTRARAEAYLQWLQQNDGSVAPYEAEREEPNPEDPPDLSSPKKHYRVWHPREDVPLELADRGTPRTLEYWRRRSLRAEKALADIRQTAVMSDTMLKRQPCKLCEEMATIAGETISVLGPP